jgi:hypothetical protein
LDADLTRNAGPSRWSAAGSQPDLGEPHRQEALAGPQSRSDAVFLFAAESLERAAAKTAEYEAALRAARSEVYQTQEQLHRRMQEEQAAQVHAAREQAEAAVRDAKAQLAAEIAQAKTDLAAQSDALAGKIADAILNRGAPA